MKAGWKFVSIMNKRAGSLKLLSAPDIAPNTEQASRMASLKFSAV
jgi:hypothetical protein